MSKEQLIKKYEDHLEKVKAIWGNDEVKGKKYIDYAKKQLKAVKKGGLDSLIKFYQKK
ncbi:MAG: hypothetical protein ACI4SH_09075 [Candidatus Scatosoma sp.]